MDTTNLKLLYKPQLDELRAFAALSVLAHHYFFMDLCKNWHFPLAAFGVHLFFVLSGFLITNILLHEKETFALNGYRTRDAFVVFYIKRILRILPLYYFAIFVLYVFNLGDSRDILFWNATYLSNFHIAFTGVHDRFSGHFWTLAIEEQFYLIYPFFLLLVTRKNLVRVLVVGILLCVTIKARGMTCGAVRPSFLPLYVGDSLMMGCLLSLFKSWGWDSKYARLMGAFGSGLYLIIWIRQLLGQAPILNIALSTTFVGMMSVWVVHCVSQGLTNWIGKLLAFKPIVYLGKISYGLYVWHIIVLGLTVCVYQYIGKVSLKPLLLSPFFRTAVSFLLATFTWHAFEKRFLLFREPIIDKYLAFQRK